MEVGEYGATGYDENAASLKVLRTELCLRETFSLFPQFYSTLLYRVYEVHTSINSTAAMPSLLLSVFLLQLLIYLINTIGAAAITDFVSNLLPFHFHP